jgi:acetolactate synthase-1/2/3 large subunit
MELATKADIPVAMTLMGLSAFPTNHRLNTGMLGMHGNYGPNIKTNECDVLIAIGMRFDDRITGDLKRYAKQAAVIHVEIDPSELSKNVEVDVNLIADAKQALKDLIPLIKEVKRTDWINSFKSFSHDEFEKVIKNKINGKTGDIIMDEVVHMISEKTKGNAIIVTDVGQNQMVTARNYRFNKTNSWITSGGLGTMGFGLPAAIGAKIAAPDREVIVFSGDGGFQMTLQELGTIAQSGIKVKMIILNNQFLGLVRQWQEMFFDKRYSFTEISSPDFIKLAGSYGIEGLSIKIREDLEKGIDKLLNSKEAYLLEVMVEREDNVFPMVPAGESVSNIRLE